MRRSLRRKRTPEYLLRPFQGDDGQWYWHAVDPGNGRRVFTGGEPFSDFTECDDAIERVLRARLTRGGPRSNHHVSED